MTDTPILEVENLEVVYQHAITAVHGITMTAQAGQIVAILGANGAGKSTTLRAISGFLGLDNARVTSGTIRYRGQELRGLQPHQTTKRGIVLIPERDKVFPNLTIAENLVAATPPNIGAHERQQRESLVYEYFPRIGELRTKEAGLLSGGERQMLAIGSAIVCRPELLLIDELSLGLAPIIVNDLIRRLMEIRQRLNLTIVLVEQSAAVALKLADYAYVLENGRVVIQGKAADLLNNADVQRAYLGTAVGDRKNYRDVLAGRLERRGYAGA